MGGVTDEVQLARAFLSRVAEPGFIPLWGLVHDVGPVDAARQLQSATAPDEIARRVSARLGSVDPDSDLAAAQRHGIRLVTPESDEWPHFAFAALERTGEARLRSYEAGQTTHSESGELIPPLALWVRGPLDLSAVGVRSVGIVGSRTATAYGERLAADLAYSLALRDFVVVSGGAFGIDGAAHRGALAAAAPTVIVSAGGVDRAYPAAHTRLFERVSQCGAVLSESPPGCAPRRGRFLTRNRLIAALSTGTVVVEASKRSGALNTAGHAQGLDRPLMAVPGPVTSAMSTGCHDLLRRAEKPSVLVTGPSDIVDVIGGASDLSDEVAAHPGEPSTGLRARLDELDPAARRVYDALPARRAMGIDELAGACTLSIPEVLGALPALEFAALVEQGVDGCRRRPP